MKKKIGVWVCAITFDNQRRVLQGILKRAKEQGNEVIVFTCHVNPEEDEERKKGMFAVMNIAEPSMFDGAILMKNSIQNEKVSNELVRRILKSGIPAVSVDEMIEDMHNVGISSYRAQKEVVEHLIKVHGLRRICYVTGRMENREALDRFQAYQDALRENGISYDQTCVYFGNYDYGSGRAAVRTFLRLKKKPEAIVFANDGMAIGGLQELEDQGIRVPEDVTITGFDNDEIARNILPSLTTVDRRQEEIGYRAMSLVDGGMTDGNCVVDTRLVIGESCGCWESVRFPVAEFRRRYCTQTTCMQQAIDAVKNMATGLAGLESTSELYERLKKYVVRSDMKSFYLCIGDETQVFGLNSLKKDHQFRLSAGQSGYTAEVAVPLAYEDGEFHSYGRFPTGEILPKDCRCRNGDGCAIVFPIAYQNTSFGYCVVKGSNFALENEIVYSWVANIGTALENIRKYMMMNQMVEQLNSMWKYDMLTHLYNRMGFYHFSEEFLDRLRTKKAYVYLMFLDLDGLKGINDTLGHEYGDACISEMAEVLQETFADALVMRYGGDEFVVLGECSEGDIAAAFSDTVRGRIAAQNQKANKPYTLSASIGVAIYAAAKIENLNQLIESADKRMYEEKKRKKQRRTDHL